MSAVVLTTAGMFGIGKHPRLSVQPHTLLHILPMLGLEIDVPFAFCYINTKDLLNTCSCSPSTQFQDKWTSVSTQRLRGFFFNYGHMSVTLFKYFSFKLTVNLYYELVPFKLFSLYIKSIIKLVFLYNIFKYISAF